MVDHPAQAVPRQGDGHPADEDPVGPAAQEGLADPGAPVDREVPAALVDPGVRAVPVDPAALVDRVVRRLVAGRPAPARTRFPARRGCRSRPAAARSVPASARCR